MKKQLCIVGSGISGLQLAYALKEDFDVTVVHANSTEKVRTGRVMSTQVHFGPTRTRESRFHMPKWDDHQSIKSIHMTIGKQKLFAGMLKKDALSVDQRHYYSTCMKDLASKGVTFLHLKLTNEHLDRLIEDYDLVIDCTGKSGPLFPFPIIQELSPFDKPQRKCITGYFLGIEPNEPLGVNVTVLPGSGEMFEIPAVTEEGPVTILFIMAVPDKELDTFKGITSSNEFTMHMKQCVQNFFPDIYKRLNTEEFALIDENAFLQIAINPKIRKPYVTYKDKFVVGCGDSVFLNDPITGQGCNLSSYCVEQLFETLIDYKHDQWDENLGESYWNRTKDFVTEITEWTNAMTQPLPEHVVQILLKGAENQEQADRIAEWFENPKRAHEAFFQKQESH
ncbi:styrene monooxygenase/indole monooxygenase family protein [Fictibacillus phosphorivorans]|uniref:styrene monooxygenase/indole monooxygenase family protein n=1 Tax=Fictibacillus phosphorivorans TaxID=1221500 RepID=UPI0020417F74|nr:styrene monooxygenase/indole monooxygenase family protein [Fictibacillus phosphorivorans]MCM3718836.1 styrene monooxygenase [Fictibacillus phosphorivorans]MCM3776458.1 styrene monooxygenase [Fictibacillus phosphorivorans]